MKLNVKQKYQAQYTHEGAVAARLDSEQQLRRSVMACMLWEDGFYENGQSVAERIVSLVPLCRPEFVAACAYEARTKMKLRHVPLLIVAAMTKHPAHRELVSALLCDVIQRADEITEFLAVYYSPAIGSKKLAASVKNGIAAAFLKFDEYGLAKYNREGSWRLRDALFVSHSNPSAPGSPRYTRAERKAKVPRTLNEREELYRKLVDGELAVPDTWEVALSGGADKRETFSRLMAEKKLGALAFLRNLRNMTEAGISLQELAAYAQGLSVERVLPFRFISAAQAVPHLEPVLEPLMLRCAQAQEKLEGPTAVLVDHSGSMRAAVSSKSDISRSDAACALAILVREICEDVRVFTFSEQTFEVAPRRGFALRDAIQAQMIPAGTLLGRAVRLVYQQMPQCRRLIVITDEQSADRPGDPQGRGYVINVATNKNGVGYGKWVHIDGWSEAVLDYIREYERTEA